MSQLCWKLALVLLGLALDLLTDREPPSQPQGPPSRDEAV
jgi:hypothetical protein